MTSSVRSFLALAAFTLSVSCGSGTGGEVKGTVRGRAFVSAPLAGAVVHVYRLGEDGTRQGQVGVSAPTAGDGSFEVEVTSAYGVLELEATGGSYTEVTGTEITVANGSVLNALVVGFQPTDTADGVIVTPLTHMATSLAHARVGAAKEDTIALAADEAYALIGGHFLGVDIGATAPSPLTQAIGSVTEDERYGLVLHGLSEQAHIIGEANALTDQALTSMSLATKLAQDLGSAEALFNGSGASGPLMLCTPLGGCTPCTGLCTVDTNVTRSGLAQALLGYFANPAHNHSGATFDLMRTSLEDLRTDENPELFADDDVEDLDNIGPQITFETPADGGNVSGAAVVVAVTATDTTSVQSITVTIGGSTAPADTDTSRPRYQGSFDSTVLPDGDIDIVAVAIDAVGNRTEQTITVYVNNAGAGSIAGVCQMSARPAGPLVGAAVTAYEFEGGVLGPVIGTATVSDMGIFAINGVEGYAGPVLLSCGGSTADYTEAAIPVSVSFSSTEFLRTVILNYVDGENATGVVITPWTSLATAHFESQITPPELDGAAFIQAWRDSFENIISSHFLDIGDITIDLPVLGEGTSSFTSASRYAFSLAGLSQNALRIADDSGATFGAGVSAKSLWLVLETDISDGCLNGRDGALLQISGIPLSSEELRYLLAEGITAYMVGGENKSALDKPANAIDWLDHLSLAGPLTGDGITCATGELFPGAGRRYDRVPPTVQWLSPTPSEGAFVRGAIDLKAQAVDEITAFPIASWTSPDTLTDSDGRPTDNLVIGRYDTTTRADGLVLVTVRAEDGARNAASATRQLIIDNTPPTISVTGVANNGSYGSAVTIALTVTDSPRITANLVVTTTLNGVAFAGGTITAPGNYTLVITATDEAGNISPLTISFTIDTGKPAITWSSATPINGAVVGATVTATAFASDPQGIQSFVITAPSGATDAAPDIPTTIVWSETAPTGQEYERTLSVTAVDGVGNDASDSRTFKFDTRAPRVTVSDVPTGTNPWTNLSVTPTWVVEDANLDATTSTLDGAAFTQGTVISAQGQHTLVVTASDKAGLSTTVTRVFYIDLAGPSLSKPVVSPVTNVSYAKGNFTVTATLDDNLLALGSLTGATFTPTVTGACAAEDAAGTPTILAGGQLELKVTFTSTAVSNGTCTVSFAAKDRAGNDQANPLADRSVTFTIDNTIPVVAVTNPSTQTAWFATATPSLTISVNDANPDTLFVKVDSGTPQPATSPYTLPALTEGLHDVTITATDKAGNAAAPYVLSVGYDKTAPVPTVNITSGYKDERRCAVAFDSKTAFPTITCTAVADETNIGPTGTPTLYKYATRMSAGLDNPIRWVFTIAESGSGVQSVTARVYRGTTAATQSANPVSLGSGNYYFDVNETTAPGLNLATTWGTYHVIVTVTDNVGNTQFTSSGQMDWIHQPLGAPVKATVQTTIKAGLPVLSTIALTADNVAAVMNGLTAGSGLGVMAVAVENGNPVGVNLTFATPEPSTPATASLTVKDRSPRVTTAFIPYPAYTAASCAHQAGGTFRIDVLNPISITCNGAGFTKPNPENDQTTTAPTVSGFIDGVRVYEQDGLDLVEQFPVGGEYLMGPRLNETDPRTWIVLLVVNDLNFLKPAKTGITGTVAEFVAPTASGTKKVTGYLLEDWGRCLSVDIDTLRCDSNERMKRYRVTTAASVSAAPGSLILNAMSRPGTNGGTSHQTDNWMNNSVKSTTPISWSSGTEDAPQP
jgi:hypothetical protein